MGKKRIVLWVVCIVLGFLSLPAVSFAAVEGIPCPPEPTDMFIGYGDLVTCSIDPIGDSDIFQFSGNLGEVVVIQATRQSSGEPCIQLYRPDGSLVGTACNGANAVRIDSTLDQTGTYTIRVSELGNDEIMDYALLLESLVPLSPSARAIQFNELITDEINPIGDADIFFFVGSIGDTITLQATRQSGGNPCIQLYGPGGTVGTACNGANAVAITATLEQAGTYTIWVNEWGNDAIIGYALDLQCIGGPCAWIKPDIAGCISFEGSPLADRDVILKQYLEPDQTMKTNANGCYRFDNAVSGKKFKVIIKGPLVP